jgi:limonene-1,2-epoxide hydrolase
VSERQAVEFFSAWGTSFDGMCDAFRANLADQCVWDQRPVARTTGIVPALRFLKVSRAALGLATVDVEMRHVAAVGNVVHTERIDELRRADGSLIAAAPVAGVLEFEGGRIVRWREYFDAVGFVRQTCVSSLSRLAPFRAR